MIKIIRKLTTALFCAGFALGAGWQAGKAAARSHDGEKESSR